MVDLQARLQQAKGTQEEMDTPVDSVILVAEAVVRVVKGQSQLH
jgi:hypothetical protein